MKKTILTLLHLILTVILILFCIHIIRFDGILEETMIGQYRSDDILKRSMNYSIPFTAILVFLVSLKLLLKIAFKGKSPNSWKIYTFIFGSLCHYIVFFVIFTGAIAITPYLTSHSKTIEVERSVLGPEEKIVNNTVVEYKEISIYPSFPLEVNGKEAIIIDTSKGMENFMKVLYDNNEAFFVQKYRDIFILHNDTLSLFDGSFESLTYSQKNPNLIETLTNLHYDTIWLFSNELSDVSKNTSDLISDSSLIVYSPENIDVSGLESYFDTVNAISINDIK